MNSVAGWAAGRATQISDATLWAGTTRHGNLLRCAASTIRARSVREDRSSVTNSVVVMVSLLATMPSSLDVDRLLTS
jgi:hypothetical protein